MWYNETTRCGFSYLGVIMSRYTEYVRTRVTKTQLEQLKQIARNRDKPIAEITRELLERYINRYYNRGKK